MNWAIYQSFSRIPLGIAVTIEFIGPLTLAVLGSRRARDVVWVLLAGTGVALLGFQRSGIDLLGVAYALLAGAAWAGVIVAAFAWALSRSGADRAGTFAGALSAVLALATLARMASVAAGWPQSPTLAESLAWWPVVGWLAASAPPGILTSWPRSLADNIRNTLSSGPSANSCSWLC